MVDDAGLHDLGIDIGHPTDDTIPLYPRNDSVFRIDPVLEGEDDGPLGQDRLDLDHHLIQIVGFHAKDNEIRPREFSWIGGGRWMDGESAIGTADRQTILFHGCKRLGPSRNDTLGFAWQDARRKILRPIRPLPS